MITLRPYQGAAIRGLYRYWEDNKGSHPLIVAPTGAGKTAIIGQIVSDATVYRSRVLILAHVKELIEQGARTLQAMVPHIEIGIYSASLKAKDMSKRITYGQIQSIHKQAWAIPAPDLIIIDEAHLVPHQASTRYNKFLSTMLLRNEKCKIVGLTATPYRLDSSWLHKGKGALFDGIAHDIKISDLMRDGWLSTVVSRATKHKIDLTNVRTRGGEYVESDLATAANDPELVERTADEMVELGSDRKSWLVFCCGIDHAYAMAEALAERGIQSEVLTGKHGMKERADKVARFKAGNLRCLVNVNVLTTGFDAPNVDLLALVRATKSAGLYVQMVGRGTRLHDSKKDCLVLDYGSNVVTHGLIDDVKPRAKSKGEPPVKVCPECNSHVPIAAMRCSICGHYFETEETDSTPNHASKSYDGALIRSQERPSKRPYKYLPVSHVSYAIHKKKGKPDSLKVSYVCGLSVVNEWLCPQHGGYATEKYHDRLAQMKCRGVPETAEQALAESRGWPMPVEITVEQDGDFLNVVEVRFANL